MGFTSPEMRRLLVLSAFALATLLCGCASDQIASGEGDQCVPYARLHSGIAVYGDAYTWWDQSATQYRRGSQPIQGAVLVLDRYAGPTRAHLAVVRSIVSPREIRIDHANWFNDGAIYVDDPVEDVSAANDWSQVRVWNIRTGAWGVKTYPVRGFIGPDRLPSAASS